MSPKNDRAKKAQSIEDPVRRLIMIKANEQGQTLAMLSRAVGRNPSYMQQFIYRHIPRILPEITRHQLARLLRVEESRLKGFMKMVEIPHHEADIGTRIDGELFTREIPTYGHSHGGDRGEIKLNEANKTGDVPAPPALINARDAYALYIVGDRMEPRFFAGELVYVHPGLPVRNGDFVVLELVDNNSGKAGEGNGSPLALVRRQVNSTTFAQLHPFQEMVVEKDQIVAVRRIVLTAHNP